MVSGTSFETLYAETLRPQLVERQRRGRRWLAAFWLLVVGGWALAMWIIFAEPISSWWLAPLALAIVVTGLVVVGKVNGLRRAFCREVLGRLYAVEFAEARHDPDGQIDEAALDRAGLFSPLFGELRRELGDRLDCVHQGMPLTLCAAGIWVPRPKEQNRPDETLFVGTLFALQARLPLGEPVVLLRGETPAQPMPPALALERLQQVLPGHAALDNVVRVLCNTPSEARAALPPRVVQALADFVSRHPGPWRVVLDGHGLVGGVDGPLLTQRLHPRTPLPDASAVRAEVGRVQTVLELVAALTVGQPRG